MTPLTPPEPTPRCANIEVLAIDRVCAVLSIKKQGALSTPANTSYNLNPTVPLFPYQFFKIYFSFYHSITIRNLLIIIVFFRLHIIMQSFLSQAIKEPAGLILQVPSRRICKGKLCVVMFFGPLGEFFVCGQDRMCFGQLVNDTFAVINTFFVLIIAQCHSLLFHNRIWMRDGRQQ